MSKFKYCPMCAEPRADNSKYCSKCNFEFLTGKYVKVQEEEIKITEKVSQEEFVESNQLIQDTSLKINVLISRYLNYSLSNKFNENLPLSIIREYISSCLNSKVPSDFDDNYLQSLDALLNDEGYKNSINLFLQWIDENRSHLPGLVLNQYMIPHQNNVNRIEEILDLELEKNEDNDLFFDLLNKFLISEKEFIERLI
ncbi:hypothetical protein mru_1044 [Methanobrevibacter ruminantium M1]|uniref:Uncharacterized protein n=2 Tax=Methanobrevibacter ruminantium TaxID=83816 RepID=D3E2Y4_METRM|nr:hypothetical protein mru_1044 [Methanobrevibacter ruminantium M1]